METVSRDMHNKSDRPQSIWYLAFVGLLILLPTVLKARKTKKNQTVSPKQSTDSTIIRRPELPRFTPDVAAQHNHAASGGYRRTTGWEKGAVLVAFGILLINGWQSNETRKAAVAATDNKT